MTELVARARADGMAVDGEDRAAGAVDQDRAGVNSRNGTRAETVLTRAEPVDIEVPRDRDGSFEPQLVRKQQRRLGGIDGIVLSLSAKGLTTGEISAHLAEFYGASVSKDTTSSITDRVLDGMAEWQNRPLDPARSTRWSSSTRSG